MTENTVIAKEWIGSATITKTDSDGEHSAWLVQYSFDYEGDSGVTAKLTFMEALEWLSEQGVPAPTPSAPSWQLCERHHEERERLVAKYGSAGQCVNHWRFPMSSRLTDIKARAELVAGKPDNREPTKKEWDALTDGAIHDVPALLAAVEAVLELHEPEATGYGDWVCGACISAGSHDWESTAYPCPTVQAIQSALGEGEQ